MQGRTFQRQIPNGGAETTRSIVGPALSPSLSFVAVQQPAVSPRRTPFPAAESLLAPASPSPRRDVFSAKFSSSRETREQNIEDRVVRSVG